MSNRNEPRFPVVTFLVAPVAVLVAVMVAPAITALLGSVTVPMIDPVGFCAKAGLAALMSKTIAATARHKQLSLERVLNPSKDNRRIQIAIVDLLV